MAKKLNHNFSFGDDDLQTFVKQYKASAAAKGMLPSLRSVDERLAIQNVKWRCYLCSFIKGLREPYG